MENLPPELVLRVFGYLSKTNIANLRLVKCGFAQVGTEFMFNIIRIKPTKIGLLPLLDISHSCHLACHVKKVVLYIEDYRHLIWIPLKKRLQRGGGAKAQNSRKFEEGLKDIEDFQVSSDCTAILASSFCRLPNLEALQIQEMPSLASLDKKSSDEMVDYGLGAERLFLYHEGIEFLVHLGIYRAFYALVTAAYFSGLKLVSFQSNTRRLFNSSGLESRMLVERSKVVFRNCRVMDLELHQRSLRHQGPATNQNSWVEPFYLLSSAAQLEKIGLKFVNQKIGTGREAGALFTNMLQGSYVWTCLKELKLENIVIADVGILSYFLQRHSNTLRRLSLNNCELFEGSWMDVVKGIKQTWGLELAMIELGLLLDHSTCNKTLHWHNMEVCLGRVYSEEELAGMLSRYSTTYSHPVTSQVE